MNISKKNQAILDAFKTQQEKDNYIKKLKEQAKEHIEKLEIHYKNLTYLIF